jgi:hypothetical protein
MFCYQRVTPACNTKTHALIISALNYQVISESYTYVAYKNIRTGNNGAQSSGFVAIELRLHDIQKHPVVITVLNLQVLLPESYAYTTYKNTRTGNLQESYVYMQRHTF